MERYIVQNLENEKFENTPKLTRKHYEQDELNKEFQFVYAANTGNSCQKYLHKTFSCNFTQYILGIFPIISWLSNYSLKNDLLADIITGCTVAIMHIPQGMGYALLGNVPPIVGIYMAFFPVLLYVIFGTSRHNSMGTFAVISIMVGKLVDKYSKLDMNIDIWNVTTRSNESSTETVPTLMANSDNFSPIAVASAICFIVGVIQLIMYILRLGIFSSLLSESLVSGLTTGAAIHVLTSQIKDLFGISIPKSPGYFEVVNTYISIFQNIHTINVVATILSAATIVILIFNNEFLKNYLAKFCSFPVPAELILVLTGTFVSKYFIFDTYSVQTLNHIPTGFPDVTAPNLKLIESVLIESIPIAVVSYTVSISMALIFAQKMNYQVDANQELFAMGIGNVFGSFFSCMPFSASLSRSTIQHSVGGKTQIASLISCGILAIILLWIGPFFEPLPRCVLAGIIVVSLKGMLKNVVDFFSFLKLSKMDASVWLITFLVVVFIAIDIGLIIGLILSLSCIFIRGIKPYACLLGRVPNTDLYLDINRYKSAIEIRDIKIFHFCGSINFASKSIFSNQLSSNLNIDITKEIQKKKKLGKNYDRNERIKFNVIIFDFSALSYIDPSGVNLLKSMIHDLNKLSITVCISGVSCPVYDVMTKCDFKENENLNFKFFPTIHDSVYYVDCESIKFIDI